MFDENLSHISGAARLTCALLILIHSPECSKYPAPCRESSKESLAYLLRSQGEIFFLRNLAHISIFFFQTHMCTSHGVPRSDASNLYLFFFFCIYIYIFRFTCALLTASYAAMPLEGEEAAGEGAGGQGRSMAAGIVAY